MFPGLLSNSLPQMSDPDVVDFPKFTSGFLGFEGAPLLGRLLARSSKIWSRRKLPNGRAQGSYYGVRRNQQLG